MISVPIKITTQEVIDFPKHMLECNSLWSDIIDPDKDDNFKRKRNKKSKKKCEPNKQ